MELPYVGNPLSPALSGLAQELSVYVRENERANNELTASATGHGAR